MAKAAAKAPSKSAVLAAIADGTGLSKKQVASVFDALANEVKKSLGKKGTGAFQIPGLVKITKKMVKARPARTNVPDPFNPGQFRDYPAKPAYQKVAVRALKNLKGMV